MISISPVDHRPAATRTGRIVGIDVARALAMFAMVIAHYVWPDDSGSVLDIGASATSGRAMPLFVLLGGLGATILTARSATPDRALLIRAAILFPLGVALQEATTFIAIILQSYALFFALAPLFRRMPSRALLALAVAVTLIGSWAYQGVAFEVDRWTEAGQLLTAPETAIWSLFFNGYYPFFPVVAFFLIGMVVGRLDLRSTVVARNMAIWGTVVGIGTLFAANAAIDLFNVDRSLFNAGPIGFRLGRVLDTEGHSEMLAWVVSATGTSLAVLGITLLVTPILGAAVRPFVALGQLALTFYIFQAVLVRWTTHPRDTEIGQEFVTAMIIYFGFMVFAVLWTNWFRSGPFEALLRTGSRSRSSAARAAASPGMVA